MPSKGQRQVGGEVARAGRAGIERAMAAERIAVRTAVLRGVALGAVLWGEMLRRWRSGGGGVGLEA